MQPAELMEKYKLTEQVKNEQTSDNNIMAKDDNENIELKQM